MQCGVRLADKHLGRGTVIDAARTAGIFPIDSTHVPSTMITLSFADWSNLVSFTAILASLFSRDNSPSLVKRGVS
jgi:hypothetical protein